MIGGQVAMAHPSSPAIGRDPGIPRRSLSGAKVRLLRLGPTMIIEGGAARSGRQTARPHACPAAPSDFARGDRWRGATVDFLTNQSQAVRPRSKYGIPLQWASVLIDPGSVLSLIDTELSYRSWKARLKQVDEIGCEPDPRMADRWKTHLSGLSALLRHDIGRWRDHLRSGHWLASAPVRGVWVAIDPVEWWHDRDTSLTDWLDGRVSLGTNNYLGIHARPSYPLELDIAAVAFGHRALALDYLRALQDEGSAHYENSLSQLRRYALLDIASGYLELSQMDENTGKLRPISRSTVEGARILSGNTIHLANGEMIRGVHAGLPDPFAPTFAPSYSPPEPHLEAPNAVIIDLPADVRKVHASGKAKGLTKDAKKQQGKGSRAKRNVWPWDQISAEIIRLSLLAEFPADMPGRVNILSNYCMSKHGEQPSPSTIYEFFEKYVPPVFCLPGQYQSHLSDNRSGSSLHRGIKPKDLKRIWGELIGLAQSSDADSLSHDDLINHLTGFCISELKYRPYDLHLRKAVFQVWPIGQ